MKTIIGKLNEIDEFDLDLIEYRNEHMQNCDLGDRCQSCRMMLEEEFIGRIQQARNEYQEKILPLRYLCDLLCVYCGGHSKEKDHLLPSNWTGEAVRKLVPTVPSCRFCNQTIKDFSNPIISARSNLIAKRIRTKYRKQLNMPMRNEFELAEFGYRLRLNLEARQNERVELHAKLKVLDFGGVPELPASYVDWLTVGNYQKFL
jgi:hypothetical protein